MPAVKPPSTSMLTPLTYAAASLPRKARTVATSHRGGEPSGRLVRAPVDHLVGHHGAEVRKQRGVDRCRADAVGAYVTPHRLASRPHGVNLHALLGEPVGVGGLLRVGVDPRERGLPVVDVEQFVDRRQPLRPPTSRDGGGVDDRTPRRDPVQKRRRQPAERQEVDGHDRAGRQGSCHPGVVEQDVDGTLDPVGKGSHRRRVAEVGRQEGGGGTARRRVAVDDGDGTGAELGEHDHERGADAGGTAGDDDMPALIPKWISHGVTVPGRGAIRPSGRPQRAWARCAVGSWLPSRRG